MASNPVRVPLGLWPEQSRLAMMRGDRPATVRQLAMFWVGAAENRVTTLDLTPGVCPDRHRSALCPHVRAELLRDEGWHGFAPLELSKYSWYPAFIGGLVTTAR